MAPRIPPRGTSPKRRWSESLRCHVVRILPGELHTTAEADCIETLLGSCVSVCLRDPAAGAGGVNHFMLPENPRESTADPLGKKFGGRARYGAFAIERMINELLHLGARRGRFEAKLVGGASVLSTTLDIGARNVEFARAYLRNEGIRVVASHVGGTSGRKLRYYPRTGVLEVSSLSSAREVVESEEAHRRSINRPKKMKGELF